jgi:hypothetical protein
MVFADVQGSSILFHIAFRVNCFCLDINDDCQDILAGNETEQNLPKRIANDLSTSTTIQHLLIKFRQFIRNAFILIEMFPVIMVAPAVCPYNDNRDN